LLRVAMRYIVRNAIFCVTCVHYDVVRQTRYIVMRYMQYFALQRNLATPLQAREKQTSVRRYYPDSRSSGFLSALNVHACISEITQSTRVDWRLYGTASTPTLQTREKLPTFGAKHHTKPSKCARCAALKQVRHVNKKRAQAPNKRHLRTQQ